MTWEEALDRYAASYRRRGYAPATIRHTSYHVQRFYSLLSERFGEEVAWESPGEEERLERELRDHEKSQGYRVQIYKTLKTFWNFCVRDKTRKSNPAEHVPRPAKAKPRVDRVDFGAIDAIRDELRRVYRASPAWTSLRNLTLYELCYATGIRPGEALGLRAGDVNLALREVVIPATVAKTRVARVVYLPIAKDFLKLLKMLIDAHKKYSDDNYKYFNPSGTLFCNEHGKKLNESSWYLVVRKVARKLNIPNMSPYMLRHAYGTHIAKQGLSGKQIAAMMGHASSETSDQYIHFADNYIKELAEQNSPLNAQINAQKQYKRRMQK